MSKQARTDDRVQIARQGYVSMRVPGTIEIATARLPTPENTYDADFCWAVERLEAVSLFFAKEKLGHSDALRSRLELRFPRESFLQAFMGSSVEFRRKLREALGQKYEAKSMPAAVARQALPADKEHSEWVNFDLIAYSGSQASLDFFHLPPAAMAQFAQTQSIDFIKLNPIVRVLTTSSELGRLLAICETIEASVSRDQSEVTGANR